MIETWYILEDGSAGDPAEVVHDASGLLKHKDGRAVAYGPNGPLSRGDVDAEAERAKSAAAAHPAKADVKPKHLTPEEHEPKHYRTRESKAE